jgi:hypothetical protein
MINRHIIKHTCFQQTIFASRIGIVSSYSIFNVKYCKERQKNKKNVFINFELAVNML